MRESAGERWSRLSESNRRPAHYESVDEGFQRIHSRPDQGPDASVGPVRTSLNGMHCNPWRLVGILLDNQDYEEPE
jgi:hypothetical protein